MTGVLTRVDTSTDLERYVYAEGRDVTYHQGGENTFMPEDGGSRRIPGQVGLHCIGGVIEHLPALTAIGCSTVNSYRRL